MTTATNRSFELARGDFFNSLLEDLDGMTLVDLLRLPNVGRRSATTLIDLYAELRGDCSRARRAPHEPSPNAERAELTRPLMRVAVLVLLRFITRQASNPPSGAGDTAAKSGRRLRSTHIRPLGLAAPAAESVANEPNATRSVALSKLHADRRMWFSSILFKPSCQVCCRPVSTVRSPWQARP